MQDVSLRKSGGKDEALASVPINERQHWISPAIIFGGLEFTIPVLMVGATLTASSTGFQLTRSLLAIGSGETSGKGYGTREVYLPESHTDFIFSIVGEEFGFVGASIVVSLFFLLIYHITKIGMETNNNFLPIFV